MTRQKVHQCQDEDSEDSEDSSLNTESLAACCEPQRPGSSDGRETDDRWLKNEFIERQRAAVFACGQMKV